MANTLFREEAKKYKVRNWEVADAIDLVDELERLSIITRTPIKDIASKAIRFALEYAVTKPVECFDVEFIIDANREG